MLSDVTRSSGNEPTTRRRRLTVAALAILVVTAACGGGGDKDGAASSKTDEGGKASSASAEKQVQKEAPADGTGNIQGSVHYNDAVVAGIKVMLCEKFSRFIGGCSGAQYEATTADDGVYVVADVKPGEYEGLLVSVFDTDQVQFVTSGLVSAKTYSVKAGKTLFVDRTHLFKSDLNVTSPASGGQVAAEGLSIAWDAYADAAHYELSIQSEEPTEPSPVTGQRVSGTSFIPPKALNAGSYRVLVSAFNAKGRKLAENPSGYVFTVTG